MRPRQGFTKAHGGPLASVEAGLEAFGGAMRLASGNGRITGSQPRSLAN